MLKGDLGTTPLAEVLTTLADTESTGCLHIDPGDGRDEALVYLKAGVVYSAHVPGRRPQLGARLVSSGALPPEGLEEALEAQQTELHGWRLGELLVHLGFVDQEVVSAFVLEQLREATFDLSGWREGTWKFRKNEKTREDVGGRIIVSELLAEVARRRSEWLRITPTIQGADAIPVLSSAGSSAAEMTLDQDQWALLCKVDGERNLGQLARDCGFTTFEAGQVVYSLVGAGLLEVETATGEYDHLADDEDAPDEDAEPMSTADAVGSAIAMLGGTRRSAGGGADAPSAARPGTDAIGEPAAETVEPDAETIEGDTSWADLLGTAPADDGGGESELGRLFSFGGGRSADGDPAAATTSPPLDDADPLYLVSEALRALLDSGLEPGQPPATPPAAVSLAARRPEEEPPEDPEVLAARERQRAAAAEELARAHADAEQYRVAAESHSFGEIESLVASLREQSPTPPPSAPAGPSAEELEAQQVVAELEAQQAVEERVRAAEERVRAAGAAERAADQAEAAQARAGAERADRAAVRAAEEAALVEAERLAGEQAQLLATAQAQRLADDEAQRVAAEQAERVAAEQAQRLAAREAELAAAEEADRLAEEPERLAAQQAQRLAAEQAEMLAARAAEQATPDADPGDVAAMLRDVGSAEATAQTDEVEETGGNEGHDTERVNTAPHRRPDNDTASLLRELSSLGLDDAPTPAAPPPRPSGPPRPSQPPAKDQKKRKGLFGR